MTPSADQTPAEGGRRFWILLALGTGAFMSTLGASAVNVVLPIIRASFNTDVATIQWVLTSFLLVVSALLLSFGRLGDLRGHRPVFLFGYGVFLGGCLLCGFAPSTAWLIIARTIQALGAAMLAANSPGILTKAFPAEARGRVLGLLSMMTYLGLTVGPPLGGWVAERWSWRGVFFMNVPVGIVAFVLGARYIPRDSPPEIERRFDLAGAAVFTAGLTALLLALNRGGAWGWGSASTLLTLVFSMVCFIYFVFIEGRVKGPMLDLDLFRSRVFTASAASAGLNYVSLFTCLFLLPFYLIQARGVSASLAGALLAVQPLTMVIAAPLSGILSDRIGSRLPSTVGMSILACGMLILSRLGPTSPMGQVATGLAVVGVGTGIFISPNSSALMGAAPRSRQGIAGGILGTARNAGMVLGVGISGAIFATLLARGTDLYAALRAGFLAAAIAAAIGVPISAMRGEGTSHASGS